MGGTATHRLTDALLDAPADSAELPRPADPAALDEWAVGAGCGFDAALAAAPDRRRPRARNAGTLTAPASPAGAAASARGAGSSCCSRRTRRRPTSWRSPRWSTRSPGASVAPSASSSTWSTSRLIATRGWFAPPPSGSGWGSCGTHAQRGCAPRAGATSPTIRRGAARSLACAATLAPATGAPVHAIRAGFGRRPNVAPPWRPRWIQARPGSRAPGATPLAAPAAPSISDRPAGAPVPCDTGGSPR